MASNKGWEVDVFVATDEAGLDTATPVSQIDHTEWKVDQGTDFVPKGHGSRQTEVKEGLMKISGNLVRRYDATKVSGADYWMSFWQGTVSGALSPRYLRIKNKTTLRVTTFKKVKGDPNESSDTDGFVTQTLDFKAEEIAENEA